MHDLNLPQISGREYQENEVLRSLLTIEQRQAIYDEKIRTLMKVGRIQEKDMKDFTVQLKKVFIEYCSTEYEEYQVTDYDQFTLPPEKGELKNKLLTIRILYLNLNVFCMMFLELTESELECNLRRWLDKPTSFTKQNLPPFSQSGDINDAPFPMPRYIIKHLNKHIELISLAQSSPSTLRFTFESDALTRSIEQPFPRTLFKPIVVDKETVYGDRTKGIQLLDMSQKSVSNYQYTDYVSLEKPKTTRLPVISSKILSTNEKALQKCPNFHIKEKKILEQNKDHIKEMNKLLEDRMKEIREPPTPDAADIYRKKFAEQMSKNITEFEAFCLAFESKPPVKKRRSQK